MSSCSPASVNCPNAGITSLSPYFCNTYNWSNCYVPLVRTAATSNPPYRSEKLETGQASMARLSAPTALSCAEQHHAPSGNGPLNSTFHFADARSSYYAASPINYCFTRHQRRWGTDWRTSPAVQGSTPTRSIIDRRVSGPFLLHLEVPMQIIAPYHIQLITWSYRYS